MPRYILSPDRALRHVAMLAQNSDTRQPISRSWDLIIPIFNLQDLSLKQASKPALLGDTCNIHFCLFLNDTYAQLPGNCWIAEAQISANSRGISTTWHIGDELFNSRYCFTN